MAGCKNKRLFTRDRPRAPVCRMVAAYVSGNALPPDRIVTLITTVNEAVGKLRIPAHKDKGRAAPWTKQAPQAETPASRSEVLFSITPDGLRSFEDGKVYGTLRRHLASKGLDPVAYRSKWGLPSDYPMTCPLYSERRSAIARQFGLGQVFRA